MANGVGLSTPPLSLLKTADSFTQKYFVPVLSDAVFKPSPTYWRLTRKGRKVHGGAIVVPVAFKEEDSGGAYWGAQILDTTITDSVQPAQWEWKQYYQSIVVPYTDVILNSGPTGVLDLLKVKEEIAMASLLQKLSRAIYKTAPQNTAIDMDSLTDGVASATNVYAGIDRNVAGNEFWKPQVDATAEAISLAAFQRVYGSATFGNEEPDTILTRQQGFNAFHQLLVANIRYPDPDQETINAGFRRNLVYNNAVVLHDQYVDDKTYFLNSKYIDMCFHESDYFVVDPFLKPSNQRILVSGIYVTLNLKVWNPRMQAVHTGFSND